MDLPNIFTEEVSARIISRIRSLTPESNPHWGKMNATQMLAHCNVPYEMIYDTKHPKPNPFMQLILKLLVKKTVTGELPYKKNNPTAPQFIIKDERDFELEKNRLIKYINKTRELGENHFDKKKSHSFGLLSKNEWNNMLYKHLDHHLTQFGA